MGMPKLEPPQPEDAPRLWEIARDSGVLDVNSPYSYALWCRDFAQTSVVARDETGTVTGFVTGYVRPEDPGTLFVWQVAVDAAARGQGLAGRMLGHLGARLAELGCGYLEATVTPDNIASTRMFESFARSHGARLERRELFGSEAFPDEVDHDPEVLFRIGPVRAAVATR